MAAPLPPRSELGLFQEKNPKLHARYPVHVPRPPPFLPTHEGGALYKGGSTQVSFFPVLCPPFLPTFHTTTLY